MKFNSKKDWYFKILNISILSISAIFIFFGNKYSELQFTDYLSFLPILLLAITVALIYNMTKYEIKENLLICKSLFYKDNIPIDGIHSIRHTTKFFMGSHPATAKSGLLIKHRTNQEIYITPEDQDVFIEKLLELNSDICINGNLKQIQ